MEKGEIKSRLMIALYAIVFLVSFYSIFIIRYDAIKEGFFMGEEPIKIRSDLFFLKLTTLVLTAIISFILMLSSYFVYSKSNKNLIKSIDKDLKRQQKLEKLLEKNMNQ